jgi:UDP-N-acetylglucosamine 2-epimerase (non-hydrolysing)
MSKLKVLSIFGTRPEAVKMAPVVRELQRQADIASWVCVTGQHRQMLDQVLDIFAIKPDYDLNIMRPDQSPNQVTARVLQELEPILADLRPDWVLVQGDTTTVMAAAVAARHHKIKIGHVEAGLRTGDMHNPFPEEMNRVITDAISDLHFAPTSQARLNLLREGIRSETITVTGNTVIDALFDVAQRPWTPAVDDPLYRWRDHTQASSPRLILVTVHRRENFGAPLDEICQAIRQLALYGAGGPNHDALHIVYPVHLNPNVQGPVRRHLADLPNVTLLAPLDYVSLVQLMKRCTLVLTDSGGIQEEAPSLGVPVLVLRKVSERMEGVEAGTVRLVGTDAAAIVDTACRLLQDPAAYRAMAQAVNPYGDGHAAERIVARLGR